MQEVQPMFCTKCGNQMLQDAKFCTRCGSVQAVKKDFVLTCAKDGCFLDENDKLKFSKKTVDLQAAFICKMNM